MFSQEEHYLVFQTLEVASQHQQVHSHPLFLLLALHLHCQHLLHFLVVGCHHLPLLLAAFQTPELQYLYQRQRLHGTLQYQVNWELQLVQSGVSWVRAQSEWLPNELLDDARVYLFTLFACCKDMISFHSYCVVFLLPGK